MVKRRRDWGGERKKDALGGFIVFWITISETEMPDWSATCQSVNTKKSHSQGSQCGSNFCRTWWPDKNCSHCTPVSKRKRRSVIGLTSPCFCGTWNIFSIKIYPVEISVHDHERSMANSKPTIILYCQASLLFCFLLRLLWGTLFFTEFQDSLRYYHCNTSQMRREPMFLIKQQWIPLFLATSPLTPHTCSWSTVTQKKNKRPLTV